MAEAGRKKVSMKEEVFFPPLIDHTQVHWNHHGQLEPSTVGGAQAENSASTKCLPRHPRLQGAVCSLDTGRALMK